MLGLALKMRGRGAAIVLIAISVLYLASQSSVFSAAGINQTINFQGKVVNSDGTNVTNGNYDFVFRLYKASSGGVAQWTETWNSGTSQVTVTDGIFRVALGTHQSMSSLDFNDDSWYLTIEFNGDGEMDPRIRFAAVPYAFNAKTVGGLTVTNTTGTLTVPNGEVIQFAESFTTSGANPLTLTTTGTTNVTLPTGGTLATLAGSEEFTNKTIGSTGLTFSGASLDITTAANEDLTITANGAGHTVFNLAAGGDFLVQDATTNFVQFLDDGTITLGKGSGAGTINIGTGTAADSLNIATDATTGDIIAIGNNNASTTLAITGGDDWSITAAGNLTLAGTTGITLSGTGGDLIFANSESITNDTNSTITFRRNDAGTVILNAADDDTTAALTINSGGAAALTLDTGGAAALNLANANATSITMGSSSVTAIDFVSGAATINVFDNATTKTIDIGGITNSGTDTINIATNGTAADTISIGNTNASTTLVLTGGDDWIVTATGSAHMNAWEGGGLYSDCDASTGKLLWDAATKTFSCGTDMGSNLQVADFTDTNTEVATFTVAMDIWDGTYPNVTPGSTSSEILVSVNIRGTSDDAADHNPVFRIYRNINADPTCSSTQVGGEFVGGFLTTASQDWGASVTFSDAPSSTGNVRYTVCTTNTGLDDANTDEVRVVLTEIGSSSASSTIDVRESDGSPSVSTATLEFGPASTSTDEFIVSDEGSGVTRVSVGNQVGMLNQAETVTGGWTFNTAASTFTTAINANGGLTTTTTDQNLAFSANGAGDFTFAIDSGTNLQLAGGADGTDAIVISAGDILITDGDLDLSGGDANFTLDAGDTINISKTGASAGDVLSLSASSVNAIDGIQLDLTSTADSAVDALNGINITWTESADADTFTAINIGNTTTTNSTTTALSIGTGWDTAISVGGTGNISFSSTGGIVFNGGVISDTSDEVDISGDLAVTGAIAAGTNPAASGTFRLPNNSYISARNAANGADISMIKVNASDLVEFGASLANTTIAGTTGLTFSGSGADITFTNLEFVSNDSNGTITLGTNTAGGGVILNAADTDATSALTINSGGASTLTIDTGGAATLNIGNANTNALVIGNETGSTSVEIDSGTGAINIGNAIAKTITIGNSASTTSITLSKGASGNFVLQSGGAALDCSGNLNSGALSTNSSGQIICTDDDGGTGGATAWDAIGNPSGNGAVAMAQTTQTLDWIMSSNAALDGLTFTLNNGLGTDSNTQRVLVIQNANDGGSTGTTEALLVLDNADTNEAVTAGLVITSSGGAATSITRGLDFDDSDIVTDIEFQNNETLANDTDDLITFTGAGGTNNAGLIIDLDGATNAVPSLQASANDLINVNDNLSVGLDGSTAENIDEAGFTFSGNDLYVEDQIGVNGNAFIDGTLDVDGATTLSNYASCDILATDSSGVVQCKANGPDVITAANSNTQTWADNNTTDIWNTTANLQITVAANSEVLVLASFRATGDPAAQNVQLAARIDQEGSTSDCTDTNTVGPTFSGTYTDNAAGDPASQVTGTTVFVDTSTTAGGTFEYEICSSADTVIGGGTWTKQRADLTLYEVNDAGDLAEVYPTNDSTLSAGEVVVMDEEMGIGVKRSSRAYDTGALGVIATRPALVIGGRGSEGSDGKPVALSGRVPVKVSTVNGAIKKGDVLTTSSIPGVAMKATKAGPILGVAMDDFTGDGTGTVMTFVKTGTFNGANLKEIIESTVSEEITKDNIGKLALNYLVDQKELAQESFDVSEIVTDRVAAGLEVITPRVITQTIELERIESVNDSNITLILTDEGKFIIQNSEDEKAITFDNEGNAFFKGTITAGKVRADQIEGIEILAGSITDLEGSVTSLSELVASGGAILGETTVSQEQLDGLELSGALVVEGNAEFKGESVFQKIAAFFGEVIFKDKVRFEKTPEFNRDTAGFALIKKGDKRVHVEFENQYYYTPVITATITINEEIAPDGTKVNKEDKELALFDKDYRVLISNRSAKGFEIVLNKPAEDDLMLSWTAFASFNARTFETQGVAGFSATPTLPAANPSSIPTGESDPDGSLSPTPTIESGQATPTPSSSPGSTSAVGEGPSQQEGGEEL